MSMYYDYKPYIPKQIISIDLKISNIYSKDINIKQIMENGWLGWETPLYANSIIFEDTSLKIYSCIKKLIIEFHKENIQVKCKCNIGSYYIYSISPYIYRIQIINDIQHSMSTQDMNYFSIKKINTIKIANTFIIESTIQCTKTFNNIKNINNICKKIKRKACSEYINLLYKYISENLLYIIIEFL